MPAKKITKKTFSPDVEKKIERLSWINASILNLIHAEERYLEACGWKLQVRSGSDSLWKHPRFAKDLHGRNEAMGVMRARSKKSSMLRDRDHW